MKRLNITHLSPAFRQIALLVGLLFASGGLGSAASPNVLLICVDDLKPVLGCYGDRMVKSPNIDRLAKRGVLFERAYCNQAVCAPSRNALMTGVRPTRSGIYDLGTNFRAAHSNAVTLSQYFIRHGYRAEALGKIFHVGHGNREDRTSWSVPHFQERTIAYVLPESRAPEGLTREEAFFSNITDVAKLPRGAAYESADVGDDEYPDGRIAGEAIRRLQTAKSRPDQPFFLAIGFLKPHLPFCAPKKYWDLYQRSQFRLPERQTAPDGVPKYAPTSWGELRQYKDMPESGPVTEAQALALLHGYHAAVSFMDAQLGRVIDELDRLQLATNTIVVLWGDHGWHLGDHGWWCKHSNYEQAARIPLIVVAPGITKPGTRASRGLVETVDLYPTLAELAGLPAPEVPQGIDGRSFVPTLRNVRKSVREHIFHAFPRGERIGRAVRNERYRLVEWKVPGAAADKAEFELYDYKSDPGETRNLADSQPKIVSRMRALLAELPEAKPQIRAPRVSGASQAQSREALFAKKDANRDNELTYAEFMSGQTDPPEAEKRFLRFDMNKDGGLSRDEFIHMGRMPAK
jgi:iduronate 2-sulfatase